jgi:hypothetical protein
MPIPVDVVRVNINWSLPGGELAVNTLHFQHLHGSGNQLDWAGDMTKRYAQLVTDGLNSAWTGIKMFHPTTIHIRDIKAYHLGTDGKTIDEASSVMPSGGLAGGDSTPTLPLEVASVLSLYGYPKDVFQPRGGSFRGRIYLPPFGQSWCGPDGLMGGAGTLLAGWQAFATYVQHRVMDDKITDPRERAQWCVLSRKYGLTHEIKQLRVDNLFDVQRRRQHQLLKTPVSSNVVVNPL